MKVFIVSYGYYFKADKGFTTEDKANTYVQKRAEAYWDDMHIKYSVGIEKKKEYTASHARSYQILEVEIES